jgi:glycosyltransferase XagB
MVFSRISIIVPTWNEESNIQPLVERIDKAFKSHGFTYEIVFIDDNSTDSTVDLIQTFAEKYPITGLYLKEGKQGKAESLIEGFAYAQNKLIAVISADLQYPPEAIPLMMQELNRTKADVVVGNRKNYKVGFLRKALSRTFFFVFGRLLHGIRVDVQSGLKVFKKEILERVVLKPRDGSFDLDFLIKARNAGYKITDLDITFERRLKGQTKINLFTATIQMALSAVGLKLFNPSVIPFGSKQIQKKGHGFHVKGVEFVSYTDLHHDQSAIFRFTRSQITTVLSFFVLLGLAFYLNWFVTLQIFVAVLTFFYFADLLFNMFLILRSFIKSPEVVIPEDEIKAVDEQNYDWPSYTIFCPLYKEWQVIPQFVSAMSRMDYPTDRLQIMLLLEQDDTESIQKARSMKLPKQFQIVIVPDSQPKTKPKACNYGLTKATGEFAVIYDAEDVPDPLQLKKAVLAFDRQGPQTICIQAKLNFYNPKQNILTRVFTAEYSLWFDLVLTGLQSIQGPIPLGGTSNHFRMEHLHEIKGWDAFNVTEDADLGMRLAKLGYRTAILDSTTLEEANSNFFNWFRQRSRWIKGYIQTYFVHMRNPRALFRNWRQPHILTFQLVVGGKVLSLFINPFMWLITIVYFWQRATVAPYVEPLFPPLVFYMAVLSLVFGNFFYLYYYMIGCAKRGYDDLIKYVFLVPLYWLTMSAAAWKAVYEIIRKPHFWQKTIHGLHLNNENLVKDINRNVGAQVIEEGLKVVPEKVRQT